ncbi:hypothetical protein J3R30DRAFT_3278784 [Lentinula aciculospora]|uniref:NmrA-like domain-containing protein n=1 Tax=Lentinula aciculospora TaxID=153920 RepID=A0A9W9AT35_9AGAR|nr:hypothetical protein J3R30DRAFT_3278784 [Lentinula aciculospora]
MKSQRIAVAGGTGGIGQHVVEGLLEVKVKYSLHIIVLSRSSRPDISFAGSTTAIVAIDYTDVAAIEKVLSEHKIDTILSTLSTNDVEGFATAQANLLTASLNIPTVHRFSPSQYSHDSNALVETVPFVRVKVAILESLRNAQAQRGSSLEWTVFHTGAFMNYLGLGNSKPDAFKALGHLAPFPFIFDLKNRKADVPGDGERRMVFTAAEDAGQFVAEVTQLDHWEEHSDMKGDWVTLNEIIAMAESFVGRCKLDIKYNAPEDIIAQIGGSPPSVTNLPLFIYLAIIKGDYEMKRLFNVNETLGNLVKPISVQEFLQKWWEQ